MKAKIKRLLYLRKELNDIIDNCIMETVLRGKDIDIEQLKDGLVYHVEDNIVALEQGR